MGTVLKLLDLALYLHSCGFSMECPLYSTLDSALKVIHGIMIHTKIVGITCQPENAGMNYAAN